MADIQAAPAAGAKTPADELDYAIDWTGVLETGETIASAAWTVPAPLAAGPASQAGARTVQWIAGGVAGRSYAVSCRITTDRGRTVERSFVLPVVARL